MGWLGGVGGRGIKEAGSRATDPLHTRGVRLRESADFPPRLLHRRFRIHPATFPVYVAPVAAPAAGAFHDSFDFRCIFQKLDTVLLIPTGSIQSADALKTRPDIPLSPAAVMVRGEAETVFVVSAGAAPALAPEGLGGGGEGGVGRDGVV